MARAARVGGQRTLPIVLNRCPQMVRQSHRRYFSSAHRCFGHVGHKVIHHQRQVQAAPRVVNFNFNGLTKG